jgi:hexosaminidase
VFLIIAVEASIGKKLYNMQSLIQTLTIIATMLVALPFNPLCAQDSIIPRPAEMSQQEGAFEITAQTRILVEAGLEAKGRQLADWLESATELKLELVSGSDCAGKVIALKLDPALAHLGEEGYALTVRKGGVVIRASQPAGVFYGMQSLRQLLPHDGVGRTVGCVRIEDAPRFSWRGFMLDEARYFKGMDVVKSLLDEMAVLKLNVFHWHLTDDQGWRIEIKKYPKLTEIGSKRKNTQVGGWNSETFSGVPHAGFYTQEEIKEIVAYAAQLHIEVVPEIEMPGHASAAIAAYPELGTQSEPIEVPTRFGKHYPCYNVADENVYRILNDILDEVVTLFPSEVIHIGGDEVRFDQWKQSEDIAELMKREGLKTPADVQIYFTNRISRDIEKKGRRMMGWNEILGDDLHGFLKDGQTRSATTLSPRAIIHFWKGNPALAERAIREGHDVVNSWHAYTYFDYGYQGISVQKAYSFDPVFKGLSSEHYDKVKGFGCQMWGEWIPTRVSMENLVYPRIAACAEVGWTSLDRKDYVDFVQRLENLTTRWDRLGIHYDRKSWPYTSKEQEQLPVAGNWDPERIQIKATDLQWDVSQQINGPGIYDVVMAYNRGAHGIDISEVALLQNGETIDLDAHEGFAGGQNRHIIYQLKVDTYLPDAVYSLRAKVSGSVGNQSWGTVHLSPSR